MDDSSKNPDRAILKPKKAVWTNDPELKLAEDEFDCLSRHLDKVENATGPELWPYFDRIFGTVMDLAIQERFREGNGRLEQVPKPSTIVERQMKQVEKACETLHQQLAQLDPATRTWIDQHLKEISVTDESGHRVRLRDLEKHISWPIDRLIHAAHVSEGIATRGPNNMAMKIMVERLADCWEMSHGSPPTTDKARGRHDDPFLELCQELAGIVHARLLAKGGGLSSLQLSGIVADVLKNRTSLTTDNLREK